MKEKLYNLIIKIFFILKYLFISIRKFFIISRIRLAKKNWYISRNRNFYNPILKTTVYRYGGTWSIARYGTYFGAYEIKEDAMDEAFLIWLEYNKITETANEIEDELKNIKHKILNEQKYKILDQKLKNEAHEKHVSTFIKILGPEKIMIFGRSGSGKSTFAHWLSRTLNLPLHHLDKHFYTENWIERNDEEFLRIQQDILDDEAWIIDGNCIDSLEMRWAEANLVLYFNFPRAICFFRILKRFFKPNVNLDDRAIGCSESISFSLLRYIWSFENRVAEQISVFQKKYPNTIFKEICNKDDLDQLKSQFNQQS